MPRAKSTGSPILDRLIAIEKALAAKGVPRLSPFWRAEAERFYRHPSARLLIECVGRGGDKSRTSVVMSIAEVLASPVVVPPGERHYFTHVSENKDEAAKTLSILRRYLELLRVPFDAVGDVVELRDLPRGWRVLAARVGAVSGYRCIGWTADECAKWSDDGVDPSAEVIASIKAMTITHPDARGRMISSPVSSDGYFHDAWAAGDTETQVAGHAPSWVANASITEEQTRALEPDPRVHGREYAAIPSSGVSSAFDADDVERAFARRHLASAMFGEPIIVFDWSSGGRDATTWARAVRARLADGREVLVLDRIGAMGGEHLRRATAADQADAIAALAREVGATDALGDQREAFTLREILPQRGIRFIEHAWTNATKREAVSLARRWMRDGYVLFERDERLRRQLHSFREVITSSKAITYRAKGGGHDDFASLVLLLAAAEIRGAIDGVDPREELSAPPLVYSAPSPIDGWCDTFAASPSLPPAHEQPVPGTDQVVRELERAFPSFVWDPRRGDF